MTKYEEQIQGMAQPNRGSVGMQEARPQPEQEPVAYDKTEMNCFVQDLYDKKMQEGKHGHYETMFHVVHQAIKKEREACAKVADGWPDYDVQGLAEAIRARGQA